MLFIIFIQTLLEQNLGERKRTLNAAPVTTTITMREGTRVPGTEPTVGPLVEMYRAA
jgi:hypothetical protein